MHQIEASLRPFRFALYVLFAGLLIATVIILTRFSLEVWINAAGTGPNLDAPIKLRHFKLADHTFSIPSNQVIQALPDDDAVRKGRIDLAVKWPGLEGITRENRAAFEDMSRGSPIVHIMLRVHSDPVRSSQRFARIIRPAFTEPVPAAPDGLSGARLAEGSGYGGEILYYDDVSGDDRFTIRCSGEDSAAAPAECLRHIQIAPNIALEYRYRIGLLTQWQEIESTIVQFVGALETGS